MPVPPVPDGRGGGKTFRIAARESSEWKFHPDLPATTTWGYWSDNPQAGLPYLGPTIEATRRPNDTVETSVTIQWRNELDKAFLPNDPTIMGAVMPGEPAPIVTHLHGGENHPQFDGAPLQWFTAGGETGPHYITDTYTYYNEQRASMVWYHDHALGNTRTNVYAGARRDLFHPRQSGHGRGGQPARSARRSVRVPAGAAGQDLQRRREHVLSDAGSDLVSPGMGAGVLWRRRRRQRKDLAGRRRRAPALPISDRQRIAVAFLQPPIREREQRASVAVHADRSGGRAPTGVRADDGAPDRPR
jgi:hypothetical protein